MIFKSETSIQFNRKYFPQNIFPGRLKNSKMENVPQDFCERKSINRLRFATLFKKDSRVGVFL